jgi:SH3-like domain-containing protein
MPMKKFTIILSLLMMTFLSYAQEQKRYAVTALSSIYMRIAPDYESALETQELMGTVVEVIGEHGYWREIVSPQPYKAWCTQKCIVEMSPEALKAYQDAHKIIAARRL